MSQPSERVSDEAQRPALRPRSDLSQGALPADVLAQAVARLSYLPVLAAVFFLVALGLLTTVTGETTTAFHQQEVCAAGLLLSAVFALFLRRSPLTPAQTFEAGMVFQALVALAIAWLEVPRFVVAPYTTAGISGLCLWQLLVPVLIPMKSSKQIFAATGTTLMLPLVSKTLVTLGVPVDQPAVWVTTMPVAVCGAMGVVIGQVLYDLGRSVGEARLMGNYELVSRLGTGGMGEVWRAEHRLLARPAAVKLIHPELLTHEGKKLEAAQARFEREARATATLKSPHTVELYDYGVGSDGSFFYVMELLDGLTLRELVYETGPVPPSRVIYLVRQACASLQEAHDRGLVHRDVKPANILACVQGTSADFVKVLDFGLVKPFDAGTTHPSTTISSPAVSASDSMLSGSQVSSVVDATLAGTLRGTPETMAPETIQGLPIDHRADIYALGCIAYYLLTAKRLYSGNVMAVLWGHRSVAPVRPSERMGMPAPTDLEDVILRCLEKDPNDRYQSARAFAEALDGCADAGSWTDGMAQAWWAAHRPAPPDPTTGAPVPSAVGLEPTVSLTELPERAV